MKIGALARLAGVSVDTLRFYEKRGLIAARRADNGYRYFAVETLQLVQYIRQAQTLGFSLAEIGENVPLLWNDSTATAERLQQLFQEKIAALDERVAQTLALRELLAQRAMAVCPLMREG